MKRFIFLILMIGSVFAQESKINIAVLDLDPTGIDDENARFLSDRLRAELFKTNHFNVVERDKMNTILQEQGFQQSGCTSLECAVEIGQLLNVEQMVAGTIGKIENIYSINLRLINVEKGTIVKTATRDFNGTLSNVLTLIIPEVAKKLAGTESNKPTEKIEPSATSLSDYKWSVQLKYGAASLNYVKDMNDAISAYNENHTLVHFDDYPQSTVGGLEVRYKAGEHWRYNAGFNLVKQSGTWDHKFENFTLGTLQFERFELSREYQLTQLFAGVDYIKPLSDRFNLVIGADIGLLGLKSIINQRYRLVSSNDQRNDMEYTYSQLSVKFRIGFDYRLADRFNLSLYADPVLASKFKTEEKQSSVLFQNFNEVIYPAEVNGSGLFFYLGLGYLF